MRGYVKCLWYCQRGTRGFWRGGWCSKLWEDLKDGLVVGDYSMSRDCPGYYTPEKVYILYTARVTAEGPGGGIGNLPY